MPVKNQTEYQRQWIANRRTEFFKDKICAKCGSTDRLELDHINPKKKVSHRIWSWSKERREAELAKCQVLCEKCHQEKTTQQLSKPLVHATNNAYNRKNCRCQLCRDFVAARFRRQRAFKRNNIIASSSNG